MLLSNTAASSRSASKPGLLFGGFCLPLGTVLMDRPHEVMAMLFSWGQQQCGGRSVNEFHRL